ncbi:MAG TPA: hypothetical protein VIG43_02245 [Kurthia sp.]
MNETIFQLSIVYVLVVGIIFMFDGALRNIIVIRIIKTVFIVMILLTVVALFLNPEHSFLVFLRTVLMLCLALFLLKYDEGMTSTKQLVIWGVTWFLIANIVFFAI